MGAVTVPRLATPDDVVVLARMLVDFNTEFDTPSPAASVLAERLGRLLAGRSTFAVVAGTPLVALGLVTLRPNVWFEGPVALLDELYVVPTARNRGLGTAVLHRIEDECRTRGAGLLEINVDEHDAAAQRLYERLGFSGYEEDTGERAYYYAREL